METETWVYVCNAHFKQYLSSFGDSIIMIRKTGNSNMDLYHVVIEDAYGTAISETISSDEILKKYKINVNEL
jgi:hypothetical protein